MKELSPLLHAHGLVEASLISFHCATVTALAHTAATHSHALALHRSPLVRRRESPGAMRASAGET